MKGVKVYVSDVVERPDGENCRMAFGDLETAEKERMMKC